LRWGKTRVLSGGVRPLIRSVFVGFTLAALLTLTLRAEESVRRPLLFVESAAWDLSDDGLPFRIGVALPAQHDPLSRLLRAREPRWVLAVGYATLPDLYDTGTGRLSGWGGDAWMVGAAREWAWDLPITLRGERPLALAIDFGVNYASASIPSNGTNTNFIVSPGFVWETRRARGGVWQVGLRWFHLSNAGIYDVNAGYDGLTLRFGRTW
jgi:hypothetical protein